jgi:uracil-DNA glycosylase family 4
MIDEMSEIQQLCKKVSSCIRCPLGNTRTNTVFGEGNPDSPLLFIGEAPGREEDETGRPFVGRSGKILDLLICNCGLTREDVYIANLVKCRPTVKDSPNRDRPPDATEVKCCSSYLDAQIAIIRPRVLVTLGNPATRFVLKTRIGISKLRGKSHHNENYTVFPTYHPSYIIRNGGEKSRLFQVACEDIMQAVNTVGLKAKK